MTPDRARRRPAARACRLGPSGPFRYMWRRRRSRAPPGRPFCFAGRAGARRCEFNGHRPDYRVFSGNSNRQLAEAHLQGARAAASRAPTVGRFSDGGDPGRDRRERPRARHASSSSPPARREHEPDGAAHHVRRAEARVGRLHHRGHPLLRLRAAGPEGRAAHAHHREARRGPHRGGRRHPRRLDGHARRADPGLLQHPLRSPLRRARCSSSTCASGSTATRRTWSSSRRTPAAWSARAPTRSGSARPSASSTSGAPKPNVAEIMNVIGDVQGKVAVLLDDMIDTAGTLTQAANALMDKGARQGLRLRDARGPLRPGGRAHHEEPDRGGRRHRHDPAPPAGGRVPRRSTRSRSPRCSPRPCAGSTRADSLSSLFV